MLKIKNTVTEMKNDFDGLISRVDTAEERKISVFENISLETSEIKEQRGKKIKKHKTAQLELRDKYKKCHICVMGIPGGEKQKGTEEIFETIMTENFHQINVSIKPQIQPMPKLIIFKLWKIK